LRSGEENKVIDDAECVSRSTLSREVGVDIDGGGNSTPVAELPLSFPVLRWSERLLSTDSKHHNTATTE